MMQKNGFSESTNGGLLENIGPVGLSDYTRYYEEQKQIKDARLMVADPVAFRREVLQSSSSQESSTRWPKEADQVPLPTQETTLLCKLNSPLSSKIFFARGKNILAKKKQIDSCQSKNDSGDPSTIRENQLPLIKSSYDFNPLHEDGDVAVKPSTLTKVGENQARKDMSKNLASKVPVPFLPAGMQILPAKPIQFSKQSHSKMDVKIKNPAAENINKLCRLPHSQYLLNPSHEANVNAANEPSWSSQEKSQPIQNIAESSNLNPRSRTLCLKIAFERKCLKKGVVEESQSESPQQWPITSPSDCISNDTLRAAHENNDMKELLELASPSTKIKSHSSLMNENVSKMLKLSKLAELIEEGRVLVRSDVPHSSTHNFKDFPFDATIHEALNSMSFEKPKTIQAYVWDAILRGHNVAFVSGARGGKTLGYLIPILNNLIDPSEYKDVPTGCSPLVVVICSSWENAELVHSHCCHIMKKISDFRSAVFTDATERSLNLVLPYLINGVTLLAATAPALNFLLTKGKDVISFDRCCHLVFDDADVVLKDNAETTKKLFNYYQESVQRASMENNFIPRQIVACANHWTKGMEEISCKVLKNPSVFISSCMEAAIYGGMKLDVRRGTSEEMNHQLLEIVRSKILSRTIIFCRGSDEVYKVEEMLSMIGLKPLLAHNQSIVSDLDFTTQTWNRTQSGSSILICTDDVLERLNIKNAQTLIHYFIPHHSKYDFSYRLSFAMDNFHLRASDADRPETHLLITKEFNNSLLTIVRLMQRFGLVVPNELQTEAILTFCSKEARKKNLPLCEALKAFGFCQNMKFCGLRHVILSSLDQPVVPQNGIVRIQITAVRTATQYYARILKHRNEKNQVVDTSGSHFEICAQLRNHFRNETVKKNSVDGIKVDIGNVYARRTTDNLYERVRVDSILERDHQEIPNEVMVFYIDQGCVMPTFVKDLYEIPEDLRKMTPEAIEVFLVGVKPFDHNSSWSRYSIDYVREKLMRKELEGRIVLGLSLTLWLNPLHERKRLDGVNSSVVVTDILKDLLTSELAENNEGHMAKLYHLCEIGGINLPNYIGLATKKNINSITAEYAFLEMNEEHDVEVVANDSPHQFYVRKRKFNTNLISLESEIKKKISKCKNVSYEDAKVGSFCVVESPLDPGIWCRCCIKKIENENSKFQVFFVDYGDRTTVPLNALKTLPNELISRLPFQAIACSLYGIGPKNDSGGWTEKDICVFTSLTQDSDGFMHVWRAQTKFKETVVDEVTNGPHYHVTLLNPKETEIPSLAQQMILKNSAISLENEENFRSIVRGSALKKEVMDEACNPPQQLSDEELRFDVSPGWLELFQKNHESKIQSLSNSNSINNNTSKTTLTSKKIPGFQQTIDRDHSLALIDHTLPLKESLSRFPSTKWAQNELDVIITFFIDHIEEYRLELTENHLCFVTDVKGYRYELNTSTYGYIIPEKSYHSLVSCGVKVTIRKQEIGAMWTRFIHSPLNQPWLTRDFNYWMVDDDSDDDKKLEPIVDPKYAFDVDQSETSSSDSDEECADEKWLRDED